MIINDILNNLKEIVESHKHLNQKYLKSNGSNNGFELLVRDDIYNKFNKIKLKKFPNHNIKIEPKFKHHFPDINIHVDSYLYGLELKSRNNGSWSIPGGSVMESTSSEKYQEIYIFFGSRKRIDTSYTIRFKPFWEVADGIKVTHSPRYSLNMNAPRDELFYRSSNEYKKIREEPERYKINYFRHKLNEITTKPTWYSDSGESSIVHANQFTDFTKDKQFRIISECLILYPFDLLGHKRANYNKASSYLLSTYFAYNKSIRDSFSAGGIFKYDNIKFPKIIKTLKKHNNDIINILNSNDPDFNELINKCWHNVANLELNSSKKVNQYKEILNYIGKREHLYSKIMRTNKATLSDIIFK